MVQEYKKYTRNAIIMSLLCNVVLVIIKSSTLIFVNSLAITVDLGISIVALSISLLLYYSIKLANRPADFVHNYGYGRVENIFEAIEGIVLIGIALTISTQAIINLIHPSYIESLWIGFIASIVNSIINLLGSVYLLKMAKKSASPSIFAEAHHYRMEAFISGMISVSFILLIIMRAMRLEIAALYVDPIAALLVSLFVLIPSIKHAKSSFFKLLDASVEESSQMEIVKQLVRHYDKFCEFKELKTRTAGRKKFVEFKLIIHEDIPLKKGFQIVSHLERDIKSSIPECEVLIKMEPCKKKCEFVLKGAKCPYLIN